MVKKRGRAAAKPVPAPAADSSLLAISQLFAAEFPGVVFQRRRDAQGAITYPYLSPSLPRLLGVAAPALSVNREGELDVIHWADRQGHAAAVQRSAETLEPCFESFRAIGAEGKVVWLEGTSIPRPAEAGAVVWDGILIDVSERVHAEQRLETILANAADCLIAIDDEGRIEMVNDAAAALFGYPAQDMLGRNISMLMPEPHRSAHDGYLRRFQARGTSDIVANRRPRELVGLRKDGSTFPFELAVNEVKIEGRRFFIGSGRDITARKETEAALRDSEERLRGITDNIPGIVFRRVQDPSGDSRYSYVSDGLRDLLNVEPEAILSGRTHFRDLLSPEQRRMPPLALPPETAGAVGQTVDQELHFRTPDGLERWLQTISRPRRLEGGEVVWDGVALDITARKEAERRLSYLAYHDPLTGAANRALFLDRFQAASRLAQDLGETLNVLSLGIDGFAFINTTLGHRVGDQLLKAIARRMQNLVGRADTVARVGGDRFLVLLTGVTGERQVSEMVERLWRGLREPLPVEGQEFELACSIGVAVFPRDGADAETLIKNADSALGAAKEEGSGGIHVFTAELGQRGSRKLTLQNRLRRAIDAHELVAHYQPQLDLATGQMVGLEALVRWTPAEGPVSPVEFIPVAEEFGLIDAISDVMLFAVARQLRAWRGQGLPVVPVAVNISGRQFHNPRRLIQTLEQVLGESGLPSSLIELELTESSAMRDPKQASAVIAQLAEMGLKCAIDDFGTGYSSLAVLKRFPIRKLKVDRSFVIDIDHDANDAAIVQAVIAMAHALNLVVVAEGVETESHLRFLRGLGCDQMQGYLFSKPLPADEMAKLLIEGRRLSLPE
ncbi:MAG: EAL domain-containing protein [Rhodospirillales bacterium]|nr:EAL domain-containing protein [Rhodospirillales bacterium]